MQFVQAARAWWERVDLDNLFAFETPKTCAYPGLSARACLPRGCLCRVRVRHRYLGLLHHLFMVLILIYIFGARPATA